MWMVFGLESPPRYVEVPGYSEMARERLRDPDSLCGGG